MLLPAHWQTAAVLLGVWYIGAEVVIGPGEADVALCTADRFADAEAAVGPGEIAVLSLDPFGKPVADLPIGVTDYATSVRVHGDQVVPERQPGPALDGRSADELLAAAADSAAAQGFTADDRVLSTRAVGHRRRTDRQLPGGARRGCFAGVGGQSGSVKPGPPPTDGEDHPRLAPSLLADRNFGEFSISQQTREIERRQVPRFSDARQTTVHAV